MAKCADTISIYITPGSRGFFGAPGRKTASCTREYGHDDDWGWGMKDTHYDQNCGWYWHHEQREPFVVTA